MSKIQLSNTRDMLSLDYRISFAEAISKITVDKNTPENLLSDWQKSYPDLSCIVISRSE